MIISKLLLASKGIPVLLGFDDCTDFASKHREKCEQQREFGTDYHGPIQKQRQFPMANIVQRGTEKQEGKHTLVEASAELSQTGSTSSSTADFSHEQSFSQIFCDSNKLKTEKQ